MNYNTKLTRHRGDTFPIEAKLTRANDWVASGSAIKLTMKFEDGNEYILTGTVTDDSDPIIKVVLFEPTEESIGTVRRGKYDIQVNDGSYIATHIKGVVHVIDDVTP